LTRASIGVAKLHLQANALAQRPTWPLLEGIVSGGRDDATSCAEISYEMAKLQGCHFLNKSGHVVILRSDNLQLALAAAIAGHYVGTCVLFWAWFK